MPIIFYGVRGYTVPTSSGDFFCPECSEQARYGKKFSFNAFYLYWIPVIPFKWQSYIECKTCRSTFTPTVLEWNPETDPAFRSASRQAILQTMAMMMIADGDVDEREVQTIQGIFHELTGRPLSRDELMMEAQRYGPGADLVGALSAVRSGLNREGRERVLRAAMYVAMADEVLTDEEREMLDLVAKTLFIPPAQSAAIWDEVTRPRSLPG